MSASLYRLILQLDRWDRAASLRLATVDTGGRTLLWITHLGDGWLWAILSLLPVGTRRAKVAWGASLVGAALVTFVIKRKVGRTRPRTIAGLFSPEIDPFSFPSGHGARLGVLGMWVLRLQPRLFAPAALFALLVGWSRVRLGIHTVGDVLVGYGVGALVAWVGMGWAQREPRNPRAAQGDKTSGAG